jgi:hypothetical protein
MGPMAYSDDGRLLSTPLNSPLVAIKCSDSCEQAGDKRKSRMNEMSYHSHQSLLYCASALQGYCGDEMVSVPSSGHLEAGRLQMATDMWLLM